METLAALELSDLSPEQVKVAVAMGIAVGTLYCFLGYRTLKFLIGLTGFILAGAVAGVFAGWLSGGHLIAIAIVMLIGGACGAMALFFLYRAGVFFLGLLAGALIAHNALSAMPQRWIPLAILGIGIAGGLVALLTERPIVTVATAALGAWAVVCGVGYFLMDSGTIEGLTGSLSFSEQRIGVLVAWAVLALCGAFAQFFTQKRARAD